MEKIRRYDMDWIRVIVFDILILYHVGMFFVPWGWHIKNNEIVDWLVYPMLVVNQWRIPILFIVSGMGTRFALSYRSAGQYIGERFLRLYIPLTVGMLLIVPPQVYIERLTNGETALSFFSWYPQAFQGIYPAGNFSWHHLWFLPYLLVMSILCTPLFIRWRKGESRVLGFLTRKIGKKPGYLFLFTIPLLLVEAILEPIFPINHALVGDWYALVLYIFLFVFGFMFVSIGDVFWKAVVKIRWICLAGGVVFFPALLWAWMTFDSSPLIPLFKIFNMWGWILAFFGFAAHHLNKESNLIKYRNTAVYPFYILHQTITIIIGYFLMDLEWHYSWKMLLMIIGTFGGSWMLYELLIRRVIFLRPLFGLKVR